MAYLGKAKLFGYKNHVYCATGDEIITNDMFYANITSEALSTDIDYYDTLSEALKHLNFVQTNAVGDKANEHHARTYFTFRPVGEI